MIVNFPCCQYNSLKSDGYYSSYHLYPIRIKDGSLLNIQKKIYEAFHNEGIAVNLHYIPVHRHPYYENLGFKKKQFPESEKFHREALSLPMFPTLTKQTQKKIINFFIKKIKKI